MNNQLEKKLLSLVERSHTAVFGSVDEGGYPNTKLMFVQKEGEGLNRFYFSTNTSSLRVQQVSNNSATSLYFCDDKTFEGLMLLGEAKVLHDQETKDMLWKEGDTMYYPLGPTDPDYCVICFDSEKGRYYNSLSSTDFAVSKS